MKCENCKSKFHSLKWYDILETIPIVVLCDNCLRKVLEARIEFYQNKIKHTQEQLNSL